MTKIKIIQACWLEKESPSWCEYCSKKDSKHTYLPFHSNVLNPEHICENCAHNKTSNLPFEFEIVDFFDTANEYNIELSKLKNDT